MTTNFEIGEGVIHTGKDVYLHVNELSDEKVKELLAETQAVAEQRGLLGEAAAQVAVEHSAEAPTEIETPSEPS